MKQQRPHKTSDQTIVVDLFTEDDAPGVVDCYSQIYGDQFPMKYVYDQEALIAVNRGDDHYTVVARKEDGTVIGLAGIFRGGQEKHVFELGQLMVLKAFRGKSIAERIADYAINILAKDIGISSFFVEALCNHTISQGLFEKHGFLPCALELEIMPSEAFLSEGGVARRVSLLMQFRVFENRSQTIFLPRKQREFFKQIYASLALSRDIRENVEKASGKTVLAHSTIPGAGILKIAVTCIGSDLREQIVAIMSAEHPVLIVHVQLNLTDSCVDWACRELAAEGFFCSGLLPLWFGSDGLLLQKLSSPVDYDAIQLLSTNAQLIRKSIQRDWESNALLPSEINEK